MAIILDRLSMVYRVFSRLVMAIPSLAFFGLSLVSVKERRCYPMIMEQIVRGDTCSPGPPETSHPRDTPVPQRNRGRPKGSRNRNKTEVELRYSNIKASETY